MPSSSDYHRPIGLLKATNNAPRKQDTTPNQLCSVYLAPEESHLTTSLGLKAERFLCKKPDKMQLLLPSVPHC